MATLEHVIAAVAVQFIVAATAFHAIIAIAAAQYIVTSAAVQANTGFGIGFGIGVIGSFVCCHVRFFRPCHIFIIFELGFIRLNGCRVFFLAGEFTRNNRVFVYLRRCSSFRRNYRFDLLHRCGNPLIGGGINGEFVDELTLGAPRRFLYPAGRAGRSVPHQVCVNSPGRRRCRCYIGFPSNIFVAHSFAERLAGGFLNDCVIDGFDACVAPRERSGSEPDIGHGIARINLRKIDPSAATLMDRGQLIRINNIAKGHGLVRSRLRNGIHVLVPRRLEDCQIIQHGAVIIGRAGLRNVAD